MSKKYITVGLLAGLTAGTGAGLILQQTGAAGASAPAVVQQDDTDTTVAETDATPETATETESTDTNDGGSRPERSERLAEVLAPLVADGTLTQAQADAVVQAMVAAGPVGGGHGPGDHGRRGFPLDVVASTLGTTVEELRTQLDGDTTIADVASEQTQAVVAALVAEATERIEQGVTDGRLTREQADEKLAELPGRVAEQVSSTPPSRHGPAAGHG